MTGLDALADLVGDGGVVVLSGAGLSTESGIPDYRDAEGAWNFHARGTVDDGARFRAAWEPLTDDRFKQAYRESPSAYRRRVGSPPRFG